MVFMQIDDYQNTIIYCNDLFLFVPTSQSNTSHVIMYKNSFYSVNLNIFDMNTKYEKSTDVRYNG